MERTTIALIYFIYGLAFFSMGLAVMLEAGRGSDERLRWALRPLAGFALLHGAHEWLEMFELLEVLPLQYAAPLFWTSLRIGLLAYSFLSLAAFGAALLTPNERMRRLSLMVPLGMASIWGFGVLILRNQIALGSGLWDAADVWTRYVLAIPSALMASAGLIAQQRAFRKVGMARFGQDSLWAAVAFAWYGVVGQSFTRPSQLFPSNIINQNLFIDLFGFPVQLLRAAAATAAAVFVIRFLRASEVETQRQIAELQAARLEESERREAMRGELLKRVVAAQEAERQRIGRELHDETGQALTAIGLGLRGATSTLQQDVDKAGRNLRQLEGLVNHSLTELQRLISDLRPSHLDDLGLASALRWYAGEVETRLPIKVHVNIEGDAHALPAEVKTGLFRIAQEALTNIVKHSSAQHAQVRVKFNPEYVTLEVQDDGSGFDLGVTAMDSARPTWGLAGMRERATLLDGRFFVESEIGKGTLVRVSVPTDANREEYDEYPLDTGG
ncbi:MAG: sensor histidine kinase [Anaerolineales bacterium]|nr:MAG: sensor histidine kinase [Anaerolineales bacterium]